VCSSIEKGIAVKIGEQENKNVKIGDVKKQGEDRKRL